VIAEVSQVGVEGDLAEGDDDAEVGEGGEFTVGERGAVGELGGKRLVVRRGAADGGGDPEVVEGESVVAVCGAGLRGEAESVKDGVHEVSGGVSGERASGAIAAVRSGGESEDEDTGGGISEAGNGMCPVVAREIGSALLAANALTVLDEARAESAGGDFTGENGEGRRHEGSVRPRRGL